MNLFQPSICCSVEENACLLPVSYVAFVSNEVAGGLTRHRHTIRWQQYCDIAELQFRNSRPFRQTNVRPASCRRAHNPGLFSSSYSRSAARLCSPQLNFFPPSPTFCLQKRGLFLFAKFLTYLVWNPCLCSCAPAVQLCIYVFR